MRGFWAVTDQALFAGTNFLVNILLARWLEPAAYGAFSVAFSLFLLLGTLHTALWTEPMLVYGSGRFRASFRAYQGALLRDHWRFGGGVALAFLLLAAVFGALGQKEMALSFLGLSLAAPSVLCLWLVRRGAYVLLEPRLAAAGGALYLVLYLSLAFLLLKTGLLNEATALWAMALAALLAAWAIRARIPGEGATGVDPGEVRRLHWGYGRWALLAGALSWVPANVYYLVLPAFHGLEAVAQFRVLSNLLMPILHFNGALGQILVPGMLRANAEGHLDRFTRISLAALVIFACFYWFFLAAMGSKLMELLYGSKYIQLSSWLLWLGLLPVLGAVASVMSSLLRAAEKAKTIALVYGLLAGVSVTVGVLLVWAQGLGGAIQATLLINALSAFAFWRLAKTR
jgi:O-antigen/teichoic acid export membrane protein